MIVILLLIIIAIMLFGSSAVTGAFGAILGFLAAVIALVLLAIIWSSLGLIVQVLVVGIPLALVVAALWASEQKEASSADKLPARPQTQPQPTKPVEQRPIDKVWAWYSHEIKGRFEPDSQATARALYKDGNVLGLERFCRAEVEKLSQPLPRSDSAWRGDDV